MLHCDLFWKGTSISSAAWTVEICSTSANRQVRVASFRGARSTLQRGQQCLGRFFAQDAVNKPQVLCTAQGKCPSRRECQPRVWCCTWWEE
eukprot:1527129-Amphidinium_carterae.1